MKKIITIVTLLLLAVSAFAQNGRSIYNKYSDEDGVSAVYISPAMFRLVGKIPEISAGESEINMTSVIKSLDGFYLIDSESQSINENLNKDVKSFVNSGKYELLMEAKDSGETVRIYTVGGSTLSSVVMHVTDKESTTFICIDGKISRKDFEDIIAKNL